MSSKPFPEHAFPYLNQQLLRATERARAHKIEAERAEKAEQTWRQLLRYVNQGWYLHVLELFKTEAATINAGEGDQIANEILAIAKEQSATVLRRFPSFLEGTCSEAGLIIDRNSKHPNYKFDEGFFQVQVDDRNGVARLSDCETELAEFPSDPGAIVQAVQKEHERIFSRDFDGAKFLKMLRHHYSEIIKKLGKKDGEAIPIRNITSRLGKNQKGFRTDEFVIDLSKLVERGPSEIDGFRFDLQQTKNTNQGMLLHGIAGGGYVGFITFRKDQ